MPRLHKGINSYNWQDPDLCTSLTHGLDVAAFPFAMQTSGILSTAAVVSIVYSVRV